MRFLSSFNFWKKWLGSSSEKEAARFLKTLGYKILAKNWKCPAGELDLVARDGDCLVFVEVRSRFEAQTADAARSVDETKQGKLSRLAPLFMKAHRIEGVQCRFDVVAVAWEKGSNHPKVEHIAGAFNSTRQ